MQKDSDELSIFLTFWNLKSFVHILLLKYEISKPLKFRFLFLRLSVLSFIEKRTKKMIIGNLLLGSYRKNGGGKLLIVFLQEGNDVTEFSADGRL
jgi:hypothetical protein